MWRAILVKEYTVCLFFIYKFFWNVMLQFLRWTIRKRCFEFSAIDHFFWFHFADETVFDKQTGDIFQCATNSDKYLPKFVSAEGLCD